MILSLCYSIVPMPCPRPRMTKTGHTYMPKDYGIWQKNFCTQTTIQIAKYRSFQTIDQPVTIDIHFTFQRPKRLEHREIPSNEIPHASKPDIDNLIKSVLDGLVNALVIRDDNVIYRVTASKYYTAINEAPYIKVEIKT